MLKIAIVMFIAILLLPSTKDKNHINDKSNQRKGKSKREERYRSFSERLEDPVHNWVEERARDPYYNDFEDRVRHPYRRK